MGVRWIRLDTTWSQSEWIANLPEPSRLAWVELLCFVKSHGVEGSVKRPSDATLSRMWNISKNAIGAMFSAARRDGAVVMDGPDLIITGWSDRQMDKKAAERMKAYRDRIKGQTPGPGGENTRRDTKSVTPVTRNDRNDPDPESVTPVTRNTVTLRPLRPRARPRDIDIDSDIDRDTTSSPTPPPGEPAESVREDDEDLEQEIEKHQPQARLNIIAIHGGTKADVEIESHKVGLGIEIKAYKRLCRARRDPPEIIAAAIAHIPDVSKLQPPVSLARWNPPDGMPIYEQCVTRAYKETSI